MQMTTDLHCGLLGARERRALTPGACAWTEMLKSNGYSWYRTAILVIQVAPYEASDSSFLLPNVLDCSCLMSCSKLSLTSAC